MLDNRSMLKSLASASRANDFCLNTTIGIISNLNHADSGQLPNPSLRPRAVSGPKRTHGARCISISEGQRCAEDGHKHAVRATIALASFKKACLHFWPREPSNHQQDLG